MLKHRHPPLDDRRPLPRQRPDRPRERASDYAEWISQELIRLRRRAQKRRRKEARCG